MFYFFVLIIYFIFTVWYKIENSKFFFFTFLYLRDIKREISNELERKLFIKRENNVLVWFLCLILYQPSQVDKAKAIFVEEQVIIFNS